MCECTYSLPLFQEGASKLPERPATWNASFHAYFYIPACFLKGFPDRVAAYLEQLISTNHIPGSFLLKVTR